MGKRIPMTTSPANSAAQAAAGSSEAAAVAELATRAALAAAAERPIQRTQEGGKPFTTLLLADGSQAIHSLAEFEPPRKKAHARFCEAQAFIDYINIYADEHSRVFCDVEKRSFAAIIDYHDAASPDASGRRGEHQAGFALRLTETMQAWLDLTKEAVPQAGFAEFLEDHYMDVEEPDGAGVLELAKTLEIKNNVAFKSTQRRSDGGYDLNYEEQIATRAGMQGTMEVPARLMLAIQVFEGGQVAGLPARLRFRLAGGSVWFLLKFLGLERVLRAEVERVRESIAEGTGRPVWAGAATIG